MLLHPGYLSHIEQLAASSSFGSLWIVPPAGELAKQVNRDLLPALRAQGVKLYFISIGTAERGVAFCEKTGGWELCFACQGGCLYRWESAVSCAHDTTGRQLARNFVTARHCRGRSPLHGTFFIVSLKQASRQSCCCVTPNKQNATGYTGNSLLTRTCSFQAGFPPELLLCDPENAASSGSH